MTDQPLLPPPDEPSEPIPVAPKPPQRDLVPWLYGLGFLVLAAAIFYLWQYPSMPADATDNASAARAVEQRLADIDGRLTRLEQRPTADLGPITARVDALDGRIVDQTQLASRVDTLSGRIASLSGRDQTGLDANKQRLDALTNRVAAIEFERSQSGRPRSTAQPHRQAAGSLLCPGVRPAYRRSAKRPRGAFTLRSYCPPHRGTASPSLSARPASRIGSEAAG